jgi:glutathione S-transferase
MTATSQSTLISNSGSIFTDESSRRIYQWLALMEASHQFLMAGIRMRLRPGEDEREMYRRWYQQQLQDHDRTLERMAARFKECTSNYGPASSTSNS